MTLLKPIETEPPADFRERFALREWWHQIRRQSGRPYACCGMFLLLPSDQEAIRYLAEFGDEIDMISGEDCLVLR